WVARGCHREAEAGDAATQDRRQRRRVGGGAVMYANLTDVSERLGRPITDPDEVAQVNAWIGDVESLIRSRLPSFEPGLEGQPSIEVATMVVANAVIRKVKNP